MRGTEALGKIGGAGGQSRLVDLLSTPQEEIEARLAAINGLMDLPMSKTAPAQRDAVTDALKVAIHDPSLQVAVAAMSALVTVDPAEGAAMLSRLVHDDVDRLASQLACAHAEKGDLTPAVTADEEDEPAFMEAGNEAAGNPETSTLASILATNAQHEPETA